MATDAHTALKQHFGFEAFRPGQEAVVGHLMAGHSAAAVFPTGGGKSLCYQLPALLLPGLTLVVSPLIALMKDQIDALTRRGIAAACLDSTLDVATYRTVMDQVRRGALRLLYVALERLNNERFRQATTPLRISLFAVDEAHCISEWGHNFCPDYLKLAGFAQACGAERALALTATATEPVLADICKGLTIDPERTVRTGFYRPNLSLVTTPSLSRSATAHCSTPCGPIRRGPPLSTLPCSAPPRSWWNALPRWVSRRAPTTRGCRTRSGLRYRTGSWPRTKPSWSLPLPSAWASTRRTSATCITTTCPRAWRTTPRKSDAQAETASRRSATCWYARTT